jgi:hypothetical protein
VGGLKALCLAPEEDRNHKTPITHYYGVKLENLRIFLTLEAAQPESQK